MSSINTVSCTRMLYTCTGLSKRITMVRYDFCFVFLFQNIANEPRKFVFLIEIYRILYSIILVFVCFVLCVCLQFVFVVWLVWFVLLFLLFGFVVLCVCFLCLFVLLLFLCCWVFKIYFECLFVFVLFVVVCCCCFLFVCCCCFFVVFFPHAFEIFSYIYFSLSHCIPNYQWQNDR